MRALFLADHLGYSSGTIHGATRYYLCTLPRLKEQGFAVTACFLRDWHPSATELQDAGIQPTFLNRTKWDARALVDILRLMHEHDTDIVHCAGLKSCFLGRVAARRAGRRSIVHFHDINPTERITRFLQRRVAPWTDLALGVSDAVCRYVGDTYAVPPGRIRKLYNGLDLERFAAAGAGAAGRVRAELGLGADTQVVAISGRLIPEKGHATLLRLLPALRVSCPKAILLVLGDGPERGRCEALVRSLGISAAVRFLGHRNDVPAVLAAADVVVLPSTREGLPYSAIEAMAAGRPVAAFRVGGLPEVIEDGCTGHLVPAGDSDALRRAIGRLLTEPAHAAELGRNGRAHAERFSMDTHMAALTQIYLELAGRVDAPGAPNVGTSAP